MSKAKLKVTIKARKNGQGGNLVTRIPVRIEPTDSPTGNRLYQTKAHLTIRPKTTKGGKPRVSGGR